MTITLGDLRQHCADLAHDAADTKAGRVRMNWIRAALTRLQFAHDWKWFYATQRLTLDVEVTGSDLTVTQDGNTFVRGSTWTSTFLTELWDCMVDADSTMAFQFSAIATVTATLATGQEWLQSSGSSKTYTMSRFRYSLPDNAVGRVLAVRDLTSYRKIPGVLVEDFDAQRSRFPHRRGQPECFTVRDPRYIELFPGNDSTRRALQVTYLRKVTLPADADATGTSIDWPDEYRDLILKALSLEASIWLGVSAKIQYPIAKAEYESCLAATKNRDSKYVDRADVWGLGGSPYPEGAWSRYVYPSGGLTDA